MDSSAVHGQLRTSHCKVRHLLRKPEYSGRGCRRLRDLPEAFVARLSSEGKLQDIPELVRRLQNYRRSYTVDTLYAYQCLKVLYDRVTSFVRPATEERSYEEEDKNAKIFCDYEGLETLMEVLMFEMLLIDSSSDGLAEAEGAQELRMKAVIFEILNRIISSETVGEMAARRLASSPDFLQCCFNYLRFDQTFAVACGLIEDMLQNQRGVRLSSIDNLKCIIMGFDDRKLANFCRILAITISDLDVFENKASLHAQNLQKRKEGFVNIRDINQEYLLSVPDLMQRLVSIACTRDYAPRYRGLPGEVENWMQWIDDSNSDDLSELPEADLLDSFAGGVTSPAVLGGVWTNQPCLQIVMDLNNKVEVIYVLGLFLVGKHRKKAQKKLAELKLIPGLSNLFDNFIWKTQGQRVAARNRLRGHNASCECSPEVALKIQFLRLVHSFCDHSDYKHLLVTKSEMSEIRKINEKAGILSVGDLEKVDKTLMCRGKSGLITKVVEVMKREPTSSTFRFWLARSVESYLRGSASFCDQMFLLRRGLLQHVASNMLVEDSRPKEIVQSSFDLLGELVKFNVEAFKILDDILKPSDVEQRFKHLINKSLVDSNMFIRSIILSYEFFTQEATEHGAYARTGNKLLMYVASFVQQLNYLHELISTTTVQSITQENVSCLNTTLVFLMSANKRGEMGRFLHALREEQVTYTMERKGGERLVQNFRDLLGFWKDHYLHKDKDCSALEKSSRISFDYWKETVNILTSNDCSLPTSLLHYIDVAPRAC